jgi:DNA-directed RNA polymerase specialized sigma24 family protein
MRNRYFRPDYTKLYPGVEISHEVLDFLKTSDERMEYEDYGRKRSREKFDEITGAITELPPLERSYDALADAGKSFIDEAATNPEDACVAADEARHYLSLLTENERELVRLRARGLTERQCADIIGTTQQNVNRRLKTIRAKAMEIKK